MARVLVANIAGDAARKAATAASIRATLPARTARDADIVLPIDVLVGVTVSARGNTIESLGTVARITDTDRSRVVIHRGAFAMTGTGHAVTWVSKLEHPLAGGENEGPYGRL